MTAVSRRMHFSDRARQRLGVTAVIFAGIASIATSETRFDAASTSKGDRVDVARGGSVQVVSFRVHFMPRPFHDDENYSASVTVTASITPATITATAAQAKVTLTRNDALIAPVEALVSLRAPPAMVYDTDASVACSALPCIVDYRLEVGPTEDTPIEGAKVGWRAVATVHSFEDQNAGPDVLIEIMP